MDCDGEEMEEADVPMRRSPKSHLQRQVSRAPSWGLRRVRGSESISVAGIREGPRNALTHMGWHSCATDVWPRDAPMGQETTQAAPEASWGHAISREAPREGVAVMMYREARLGLPGWPPSTRRQCWRKLVEKELHNRLLEHKLT